MMRNYIKYFHPEPFKYDTLNKGKCRINVLSSRSEENSKNENSFRNHQTVNFTERFCQIDVSNEEKASASSP